MSGRWGGRARWLLAVVLAAAAAAAQAEAGADADAELALDKGCYNCHGKPPMKKARTFEQLAADYAKHRDDPAALQRLSERLRRGSIFGPVDAHERLSEGDALRLVRWIAAGAAARQARAAAAQGAQLPLPICDCR